MIIAANTGVGDEVELIERHLRHLQAIGVDRIVVTDTGSTDGTAEILQAYADRGEIVLLRVDAQDPDAFEFANRMLDFTLREIRPDWIVLGDADEFAVPRSGSLRDVLAGAEAQVLQVPRFNVPLAASGPLWPPDLGPAHHDRLQLVVRQIPDFEAHLRAHPDTPWILGRIAPKIVARADALRGGVHMGAHRVVRPDGKGPATASPDDLLIAHLAISSRRRFMRKLDNIRQIFASHGDLYGEGQAWHWRRWLKLAEEGRADEEYERQVLDDARLSALRAAGTVMSAAEWFAGGR